MKGSTVILAAGDFPRKGGVAWTALSSARRVIACDSAANAYRRRFGRWPDAVVGDLDSVRGGYGGAPQVVRIAEQETNDLTKAIRYARERGWRNLLVVGATGRREDHTIGNVYRALEEQVQVLTDHGVFHPVCGRATLAVRKGSGVSVFAPDPETRLASEGLAWPLDGVRPDVPYRFTLNRAAAARIVVTADRPIFVFTDFSSAH